MRVKVYRNLRNKCLSVVDPSTGRVIAHEDNVILTNCKFSVGQKGREKVITTRQKNVHAFVYGDLIYDLPFDLAERFKEVTYNPYLFRSFVYKSNHRTITQASVSVITADGSIYVL